MSRRIISSIVLLIASVSAASAQVTTLFPKYIRNSIYNYVPTDTVAITEEQTITETPTTTAEEAEAAEANDMFFEDLIEEEVNPADSIAMPEIKNYTWADSVIFCFTYNEADPYPLLPAELRPTVFDTHHMLSPLPLGNSYGNIGSIDPVVTEWITRANDQADLMRMVRQNYIVNNPQLILYDESKLPEPPKKFTATVDPATASILLKEVITKDIKVNDLKAEYERKHWLKAFNANLQFSQAYVSPNWYQGGNNNLNSLLILYYNVKLNQAFHSKILFENTFQYKLGMNNAPDDKLRNYSISEDLFQWNMTAGFKLSKHWYYSVTSQFKTQFLNNYKSNTRNLKAAFLSPGELNIGVGMTYNQANSKKTFTFDASISPFSYNMKTCMSHRMNVTSFGIKEGRKTVSEYGSSGEGKISWQICENISLKSRLFVFTDYDYLQSDWENTLVFTINKFLTTQIYAHARYDTTSPVIEDTTWHKFQFKEILSFGFTYKFASGS